MWLEAQIGFVPGVGASSEIYFPLALYAPCSNEVGPGMKDVDARADLRQVCSRHALDTLP